MDVSSDSDEDDINKKKCPSFIPLEKFKDPQNFVKIQKWPTCFPPKNKKIP